MLVYVFAAVSALFICIFMCSEYLKFKKLYISWYKDWEKLAADAERLAMTAESENCPELADWLYEEAARRRIYASKYIKYLPKEEQAKAIKLNTWR